MTKSHFEGEAAEEEFLFSPYSPFTVRTVAFVETPTGSNPHVIELDAAIDGLEVPNDLPSAPWY